MLIKSQNLALTLFVSVLLSLAVTSVEAHDFAQPVRRDHDNLKRLIKKRSPQLGAIINAVGDPNNNTTTTTDTAATGASVSASASASASTTGASASDSASNAGSISVTGASQSASASASASSSASVTSASASLTSASNSQSSSTSTIVQKSTAAAQNTAAANDNTDTDQPPASKPPSTVTKTNSVMAAAETNVNNSATANSGLGTPSKKSTITTVLIVVAASVGAVAILWTIFRKWKLGHSKKFDERMAPIDWQPTTDDGIVPAHRRANSKASSFNSAAHSNAGYSDRDFTATAPSHLAPVGGYADLARGPSPQPQMQEAYGQGLARGPSTTRPAYENGLPLHHQAGFGQAEAYDYNGDAIRF